MIDSKELDSDNRKIKQHCLGFTVDTEENSIIAQLSSVMIHFCCKKVLNLVHIQRTNSVLL